MDATKQRWAALTGVAFGIVLAARAIIVPTQPKATEGADAITRYYTDHGGQIRVAGFLTGLVVVLGTLFGALLRQRLKAAGNALMADAVFGAWLLIGALALSRFAISSVLAMLPNYEDLNLVVFAGLTGAVMLGMVWFASVLFFGGVALAGEGVLPSWHRAISGLVALYFLIASLAVAVKTGPLAPGGKVSLWGVYVFAAWFFVTGLVLYTRPGEEG